MSILLHAVLGLISPAPLLEDLSISILDPDVSPVYPRYRIPTWVLCGDIRSRSFPDSPYFKAPRLEEFSLFLPPNLGTPAIADLLPSDSYLLFTKVTSMGFCAGMGNSEIKLVGKGIKVAVRSFPFPHVDDTDDFLSMTPFSFAQITSSMLTMVAKPALCRLLTCQ